MEWQLLTMQLEGAVSMGDRPATARLIADLESSPRLPTTGQLWHTIPDRHLSAGYALLGRPEEALAANLRALDIATRMRFRPELALIRSQLAELLLTHYPERRREALDHLDHAIPELQEMKMAPGLERAVATRLRAHGVAAADPLSSIDRVAAAVTAEIPAVAETAGEEVALLFSDIENSTLLNDRLGDAAWLPALAAHNGVIEAAVRSAGGRVIKTIGDGYFVAFAAVDAAVRCAVEVQRALTEGPLLAGTGRDAVRVRIGIHLGKAVRQGSDLFGREVNYAARVAGAATGGEVLVSEAARLALAGGVPPIGAPREVVFKGFQGVQQVYPLA
jgi:class 3 adenylate cyclase